MSTATPNLPGWDLEQSPWHSGEIAVQERMGVREKIDRQGRRAARRYLTDQHRSFFPQLPYIFVGSVDDDGQPWASMLTGTPGFIQTPESHSLTVSARPLWGDPLNLTLREGAELALLGVELPTRRRNRAIGIAERVGEDGFSLRVRQTLGICPQYIQSRAFSLVADPMRPSERPVWRGTALDDRAREIVAGADTFFVASADLRPDEATRGADISHRGGRPGFVRIDDNMTLTTPDFVGNFIFNTLGNFVLDPRAGLMFVDFERGDMLYLAARAEVIWDSPEIKAFAGAQRLVRYHIEQVIRVEGSLPGRFAPPDFSPLLARTGNWTEAAQTLEADAARNEWRPFRIARIEDESSVVKSFYLEPADGRGLAGYEAGQFLPIRTRPEDWVAPAVHTYTLSDAPDGKSYRISVKREGKGGISDWLHDHMTVGGTIEAMAPRGTFTFTSDPNRSVVFISAGVGITPLLAMLNSLLVNADRSRHHGPIWFIHGARSSPFHAFAAHLREKVEHHNNLRLHVRFSHAGPDDQMGLTHHSEGRIDIALLKSILPFDDHEFYLCGPTPFMQHLYDGLSDLGVRDERIHFESFGTASVARRRTAIDTAATAVPDDEEAVRVVFAQSGKTARWVPRLGTLLELAEREGLSPLSSCRSGTCGTCATRVLSGSVDYAEPPIYETETGTALICCSTPHPGPHLDPLIDREGVTLDL